MSGKRELRPHHLSLITFSHPTSCSNIVRNSGSLVAPPVRSTSAGAKSSMHSNAPTTTTQPARLDSQQLRESPRESQSARDRQAAPPLAGRKQPTHRLNLRNSALQRPSEASATDSSTSSWCFCCQRSELHKLRHPGRSFASWHRPCFLAIRLAASSDGSDSRNRSSIVRTNSPRSISGGWTTERIPNIGPTVANMRYSLTRGLSAQF